MQQVTHGDSFAIRDGQYNKPLKLWCDSKTSIGFLDQLCCSYLKLKYPTNCCVVLT
jgi:hypothetical protein